MPVDYLNVIVKRCVVVLICLLIGTSIEAQETHGDSEFWFLMLNNYHFNEKWSVGNELHIRRTEFMDTKKQFILRPYVNYKPGEHVIYTVGYSFIETHPYGRYPRPITQPEHNFWEQVTVNQMLGNTLLSHRYRMEHRYQGTFVEQSPGNFAIDGYDFSNRFRYRLTLRKPINDNYFIHVFDELWVSFDDDFKQASYNQNWIYAGVGRNIPHGNIQLAYLHQHASSGGIVERHATLQATIQYDFN